MHDFSGCFAPTMGVASRISKMLGKPRQHGLQHFGVHRCCRVTVQINCRTQDDAPLRIHQMAPVANGRPRTIVARSFQSCGTQLHCDQTSGNHDWRTAKICSNAIWDHDSNWSQFSRSWDSVQNPASQRSFSRDWIAGRCTSTTWTTPRWTLPTSFVSSLINPTMVSSPGCPAPEAD